MCERDRIVHTLSAKTLPASQINNYYLEFLGEKWNMVSEGSNLTFMLNN